MWPFLKRAHAWYNQHFLLVIILIVALGGTAAIATPYVLDARREMVIAKIEEERKAAQIAHEDKLRLREWPNPPPPPLPKLEPLPFDLDATWPAMTRTDPATGRVLSNAYERTQWLIERHPAPDLQASLPSMIAENRAGILLSGNMGRQSVGSFHTIPIKDARRQVASSQPDALGRFKMFALNGRRIDRIDTLREAKVIEVFIYHEWRHLRQYEEAIEHGRADESATFIEDVKDGQMSEAACAYHWHHEHDGWRDACLFAVQIGIADYFDHICLWVGDEAMFRQAVFNYTPSHVMIGGGEYKECVVVNARLAGHPHPEAFEP